ncbi:MAG TPA: chemotaxis protein CheW [Polyangia bacterium]|nr:chemotaxis protein CheW [Polyangia bacterium]
MNDDKARSRDLASTSPAPDTQSGPLVAGLECRVGKAPIVVPVEHVAQIIELPISPLPLARRWISGVGLHDDRLVMTVGLIGGADAPSEAAPQGRRVSKAILIHAPESRTAWALEVKDVLIVVRASILERRGRPTRVGDLPYWIVRARTADGRTLGWIDVPAMMADLLSPPRSLA